jgi:nucleotide-binding universal stress UspA family protein
MPLRAAHAGARGGSTVFLNILAATDGSPSARRAVALAVELARAGNARLTLITVAPPTSSYVTLAGVAPETMRTELDKWAAGILEHAAAAVPDDVIVRRVERAGHAGHEILKELRDGGYDLVVLGSRGRGRAQESLFGSVNGFVHFHAHVPLLSVPADDDPAEPDD